MSVVVYKDRLNARTTPVAPARPRRRPLGLAPVLDGVDGKALEPFSGSPHRLVQDTLATLDEATRKAPATVEETFELLDLGVEIALNGDDALQQGLVGLRREVSELKAALVEARHEIRELKSIQEAQRISTRGERGTDGARGVPGRDGLQGPIGPRGEPGTPGKDAARLASWDLQPEKFCAAPLYANGSRGATLNLMPFFAAYHAAATEEDGQ
jgi:hypothetical protein